MRPLFGILRHVERRQTNKTQTSDQGNLVTFTYNHYAIMVTRVVILWITVWTHESEWA